MSLQQPIHLSADPAPLLDQIRRSRSAQIVLGYLRANVPDLPGPDVEIPQTTYTLYRQYGLNGDRASFESRFFKKRAMLTRAVVELILGDDSMIDTIHDLVWSICEETSWVLPAHEERGSNTETNTSLTREPDVVDLFAAETAATLGEIVFLLGDRLSPEVVQRTRQEVKRHVLDPYLAYGRTYWWHKGDLNWNAVCNGAVGLAFLRLEKDPLRLAQALEMVLEGFDAYLATGFESDGGSLEGISYWNYGLLYYVTLAELLREQTDGQLDLLASERIRDIARFPLAMAMAPGHYLNYGDATEQAALQPGMVQRLAERTGLHELKGLLSQPDDTAAYGIAALAITLRDIAWWDRQTAPFPAAVHEDVYLPACAVVKFNGQTAEGKSVILAAKAGINDGHHYHLDIGHFTVNINGESLLCDPGRGLYTKDYFHEGRFQNIFCNSFGHSVPRIGGHLQMEGPKFGGGTLATGDIIEHGQAGDDKFVVIDFALLYGLPELTLARRKLSLSTQTGEIRLEDTFEFSGDPLEIEEAFVTWCDVTVDGVTARIEGTQNAISLTIQGPAGSSFNATRLEEECRANRKQSTLTRLTTNLPARTRRFVMKILPK